MSDRKEIASDIRVIEAIEALKRAVLSVNGDAKVVSTLVLLDVRTADGSGMIAQRMDVCPCPQCVARMEKMLRLGFADVKQEQRRQMSGGWVH